MSSTGSIFTSSSLPQKLDFRIVSAVMFHFALTFFFFFFFFAGLIEDSFSAMMI